MQALAAGRLAEGFDLHRREIVAHRLRGIDDGGEGQVGRGIEIEDELIGTIGIVGCRAPGMDLDHAFLNQQHEIMCVAQHEIIAGLGFLFDRDALDVLHAGREMLLEEAFAGNAARAAQQAQRPVGDMRQDPLGDAGVIFDELALGDAEIGEDHAIGMRDRDAFDLLGTFLF